MPRINVGSDNGSANLSPLSIGGVSEQLASAAKIGDVQESAGAAAVASAAPIGQLEQKYGASLAQYGGDTAIRGLKAMNDTLYNIVQSNAAQDYNQQAAKYVKDNTDPNPKGSVNYQRATAFKDPAALSSGLDQIANKVKETYGQGLTDPETKAKFEQNLSSLNQNHKILAGGVQRTAANQTAEQAITQALNSDIQSGLIDSPTNLDFYAQQGLDRISAGLQNGTLSVAQASKLGENLRSGLYLGSLRVANSQDPMGVAQVLQSKKASDLNLTDTEYNQLLKENALAMKDANVLNQIQYKAANEIDSANNRYAAMSLADGIDTGQTNSQQIMEAYNKGKITYPQFLDLGRMYDKALNKTDATWKVRQDLTGAINRGAVLGDFTPAQIEDSYSNNVRNLSKTGQLSDVPLMQKVDVARQYKAPIDSIGKEIQYSILSGDIDKIKEGLTAFNKLQQTNPLALSNIKDKNFLAYASALENAYKYTTGLTKDNIQQIKDSIYNVDGRTTSSRANAFGKESAFSEDNIGKTIANMYPGGNGWFSSPDDVTSNVKDMIAPLFREAYQRTGNADDAINMVKNQTSAMFGHSDINSIDRWGPNPGSIMVLPPEKAYGQDPQKLRAVINEEIKPILPEGMDPNKVYVGSDDQTISDFKSTGKASYYLFYKSDDGHDILLPKRWQMDAKSATILANNNMNIDQRKVSSDQKLTVNLTDSKSPSLTSDASAISNDIGSALSSTKGFGSSPILSQDFVDKTSQSQYINQIVAHYPGDTSSKPAVGAALTSMLGPDKSSWRVAQSMKLINSVLTNNSDPETYLKFGKVTTQPTQGDIVVANNQAGLFNGIRNINGQPMVEMITMNGTNLAPTLVKTSDVRGYRSLPTPETFYQQSQPVSQDTGHLGFNIYTGQPMRSPTGQERFNPYTGETYLEPKNAKDKGPMIFDIANGGKAVNLKQSYQDRLAQAVSGTPTANQQSQSSSNSSSQAPATINDISVPVSTTNSQPQVSSSTSQYKGQLDASNSSQGDQSPGGYIGADKGVSGKSVKLKNGYTDTVIGFENGKIRLKSGKLVNPNDIVGGL